MNADVHALAGAYALDALEPDEHAAFTDHLTQCSTCQTEVAEFQAAAARLGTAIQQPPPADLRDRVLQTASQTRQLPPFTPLRPRDHNRRRRFWPYLMAAAATVLIVAVAGVVVLRDEDPRPSPEDPVAAILEAPDAHVSQAALRGGGTMTVISSHELDRAVVLSEDMPSLDATEVYQLWLIDRRGEARSADVLIDPPDRRAVDVHLVKGLRPGDNIAVTRERAGGADQPTTSPLAITPRT